MITFTSSFFPSVPSVYSPKCSLMNFMSFWICAGINPLNKCCTYTLGCWVIPWSIWSCSAATPKGKLFLPLTVSLICLEILQKSQIWTKTLPFSYAWILDGWFLCSPHWFNHWWHGLMSSISMPYLTDTPLLPTLLFLTFISNLKACTGAKGY